MDACGAYPVSLRLMRSCCRGDTTNFLKEKVPQLQSFILMLSFSRKKQFFLSPIVCGTYRIRWKVQFQTQLFGLHFKAFLLKLETGSFLSFISVCCWGQWDDSCPGVWLLAFLPFPHFISPLFSPTAGKLSSRNRSIKTMTPCHLVTCPALMKFWDISTGKEPRKRREEWNQWFIRNKLLRGQNLHFHSSWTKITFLICFTSKFASSQGTFSYRNDFTLIFWQDFPVHFFSPWNCTNAGQ